MNVSGEIVPKCGAARLKACRAMSTELHGCCNSHINGLKINYLCRLGVEPRAAHVQKHGANANCIKPLRQGEQHTWR